MSSRPFRSALIAAALFACAQPARADEAATDRAPTPPTSHPIVAAGVWMLTQLVPSPMLVVGEEHVGFGMRWQATPLLYSFGIAERPFRSFIVSPVARHSGSIEFHVSPEWSCCAPSDRVSWLVRSGFRVYLPLIEHGEILSWSIGSSAYLAADGGGVSGDVGIYTLFGTLGLTVTVSPWLARREVITALNLRYF
ncbi:MAG TPA: hypothetical protein VHZ95_15650 [Polyangiales bacterium]|nr:hypothetical protein [Polyangiales bacterium]